MVSRHSCTLSHDARATNDDDMYMGHAIHACTYANVTLSNSMSPSIDVIS